MTAAATTAVRAVLRGLAFGAAVAVLELNLASVDTALRISGWGQ